MTKEIQYRMGNGDVDNVEKQITGHREQGKQEDEIEPYTYDDAIELAGNGWYNFGLLIILSVAVLAMFISLFSFSVVVALSSCDLQLTYSEKSILVSVPFIGPIATAYAWGYFSDTRGRRKCLLLGMLVSFTMEVLCAFSPNWITMGVFKLVATCFCSCAQSIVFALLGESCAPRVKAAYMLIMTSTAHMGLATYMASAYFISHLNFSYDLHFIFFVPWRFLVLSLAVPLGLAGFCLFFFYESPKFLLNIGKEDEALTILKNIYKRNGGNVDHYQVKKLILNEEGNITHKGESLLISLWQQTAPLFRPPLLFYTLLTYYVLLVSYSVSGALYVWLPFLTAAFTSPHGNHTEGLCSTITQKSTISTEPTVCTSSSVSPTVELPMVLASVASGVVYSSVTIIMSKFASRRKLTLIVILIFASTCCIATTLIPNMAAGLFYFGVFSTSLCMGPTFSYYVDLYPTSFRGMAACLGVMIARISSVGGVNLVGPFISSYCSNTFYSLSAFLLSGALVSLLLPADKRKS